MQCSGLPARKKQCSCSLACRNQENSIFQLFVVAEKEHGITSLALAEHYRWPVFRGQLITPPTFGMAVVIYDIFLCLSTFPCFEEDDGNMLLSKAFLPAEETIVLH